MLKWNTRINKGANGSGGIPKGKRVRPAPQECPSLSLNWHCQTVNHFCSAIMLALGLLSEIEDLMTSKDNTEFLDSMFCHTLTCISTLPPWPLLLFLNTSWQLCFSFDFKWIYMYIHRSPSIFVFFIYKI